MTFLQTDDTLNAGNSDIVENKDCRWKDFECKPVNILTEKAPLKFNIAILSCTQNKTKIRQREHIENLEKISVENPDKKSIVSQRASGANASSTCCPYFSYVFSLCSQFQDVDKATTTRLNWCIEAAKTSPDTGLNFFALNVPLLRISVCADASFVNNSNVSSQLWFVVTLGDECKGANIFHNSSLKSKRVIKSVLTAEPSCSPLYTHSILRIQSVFQWTKP